MVHPMQYLLCKACLYQRAYCESAYLMLHKKPVLYLI